MAQETKKILILKQGIVYISLLIILMLMSSFNVLISGWNATPNSYVLFLSCIVFSTPFYLKKFQHPDFNYIDIWLIGCLIFLSIILVFSILYSLVPNRDSLLSFIAILYLYIPLKTIFTNKLIDFSILIFIIVALEIILGIYQIIIMINKSAFISLDIMGSFENSGIYSIFLASTSPIAFYIFKSDNYSRRIKFIAIVSIFLEVSIILLSQSRTGLVLLIISFVVSYNFLFKRQVQLLLLSRYKKVVLAILTLFLCGFLFYFKYQSALGRVLIWKISFEMFIKKPFLGWGSDGFEKNYLHQQMIYFRNSQNANSIFKYVSDNTLTAFNEYIELIVEFGLLGLLFLGYLFFNLFNLFKQINYKRQALFMTCGLILISALFYYSFHVTFFLFLILLMVVILSAELKPLFRIGMKRISLRIILQLFFFMLTLGVFYRILTEYNATKIWKNAQGLVAEKNASAMNWFEKAYPQLNHRPQFLYNYGAELYEAKNYKKSIMILNEGKNYSQDFYLLLYLGKSYQAVGNFEAAKQCFADASYTIPSKFNPKYFLVELYLQNNQKDKAIAMAKEILSMPEKIPSKEIALIKKKCFLIIRK